MTWIVLRVQTRQERRVVELLTERGVTAYAPKETRNIEVKTTIMRQFRGSMERVRIVPKTYAIIPGIVFAFLPDDHAIDAARSVRLVQAIWCDAFGKPRRVDLERLRGLFLAEAFQCFNAAYKAPKKRGKGHTHRWKAGDEVKGQRGHIETWIGRVLGTRGRGQVEVMFSHFGRSIAVVVNEEDLTHAPHLALQPAA